MAAVRLRSVRLWSQPDLAGINTPVSIEYAAQSSGVGNPARIRSAFAMGTARPAALEFAPPSGSVASFWLTPSNATLLTLQALAGSVCDVALDQILYNGETPVAVGAAVSAATVGQTYCRPLDSNGNGYWLPIDYVSI